MSSPAEVLFSVWLIPSSSVYKRLSAEINDLASTFSATPFTPHLTLFCGKTDNLEKTKQQLQSVVTQIKPFQLVTSSVECSEIFYKTLYFQYESSCVLEAISKRIHEVLDHKSNYILNPHLSLLYKDMPLMEKKKIAQVFEEKLLTISPDKKMYFDRVRLMTDSEEESPAAVASWDVVAEYDIT